jgi:peptidoglycan/xylan/chitin deacetylase (PgdA/CDA1 family)
MKGVDLMASLQSGCFSGDHIWVFTSDDGWSDTYDQLVPIAREYAIPFFLGIITDRLDTPGFVTTSQVQEISRDPLYTISAHSIGHREQDKMTEIEEHRTMCESRSILERLIQKPVNSYIYPV